MRDIFLINKDWKFYLGDFVGKRNPRRLKKSGAWLEGPESMGFNDSDWKKICLPHDFVIGTKPYPVAFGNKNEGMDEKRILNAYGAFPDNTGWYRKHFYISDEDKNISCV